MSQQLKQEAKEQRLRLPELLLTTRTIKGDRERMKMEKKTRFVARE
jgi:hypothetical protein